LLGRSRCHRALRNFASALVDINEAIKDVAPTSKFTVVTVDDFYLEVAEVQIASGRIGNARAALANVSGGSPAFEDRISYLEICISNAETIMHEAYSTKHKTLELVLSKWQEVCF
jgi:hypothetical protein